MTGLAARWFMPGYDAFAHREFLLHGLQGLSNTRAGSRIVSSQNAAPAYQAPGHVSTAMVCNNRDDGMCLPATHWGQRLWLHVSLLNTMAPRHFLGTCLPLAR